MADPRKFENGQRKVEGRGWQSWPAADLLVLSKRLPHAPQVSFFTHTFSLLDYCVTSIGAGSVVRMHHESIEVYSMRRNSRSEIYCYASTFQFITLACVDLVASELLMVRGSFIHLHQ
ncbi:hypothetical protein VNO77_04336 [Canavalia gladiata]|uniref:Uncharacterized protein n=1 Tax=Canavalia gladiata TaxID=3824 RepID=A0AAN9N2V0_CANGL